MTTLNETKSDPTYHLQDVPSFENQLIDELTESGIDWETLQSDVAGQFRSTIQEAYREGMLQALARRYDATVERITEKLRKTESQRHRWVHGQNRIGWETICEAMAAFGYRARSKDLPEGRVAIQVGMVAAIKALRMRQEGDVECDLSVANVIGLVECCRASFHDARRADKDRELRQKREAYRISKIASTRTGQQICWDWDSIVRLREDWMRYWIMFHMAIDYDWEY